MSNQISVPDIGDFESVEIIEVLVKSGDTIKKNDPIVTLESDKSSVEVPSPFAGKILELKVKIGDKVSKGSILALIESNETKIKEPVNEKKELPLKKELPIEKELPLEKEKNIFPETENIIKQAESVKIQKSTEQDKEKIYVKSNGEDIDPIETKEWLDSLDAVFKQDGTDRVQYILKKLINETYKEGSTQSLTRITPYINTISASSEVKSPGDQNIERRIRSLIRWNAAAMVVKANKKNPEL